MYTLYTLPGTCSTGIAVLMKKLNIDFTSVLRDDVDNYSDIVPTNQVPALKTENGMIITEGPAIALYLLEKYADDMPPASNEKRAEFYQWLNFAYSTLHPAYAKIFAVGTNSDITDEVKLAILPSLANSVSNLWAILDKRLENQKYILGDTPSHVDYMIALYSSWNNFFPHLTITLGDNVKRFVEDVSTLPEFQAGYSADSATFKKAA